MRTLTTHGGGMTSQATFTETSADAKCVIDGFLAASDMQAQQIVAAQTAHRTSITNLVNQAVAMLFPDAISVEVYFGPNPLVVPYGPPDVCNATGVLLSALNDDDEWTDEHEAAVAVLEPLLETWRTIHHFAGDPFTFDLPKKVSITA